MKTKLFAWIIPMLMWSCDGLPEQFYTIELDNNTGNRLLYFVALEGVSIVYPDTTAIDTELPLASITANVFYPSTRPWPEEFQALPADTLSIYFIRPSVVETSSWDSIWANYSFEYRYDLSLQDLERLDFKVPVPPSAAMQNMQIFRNQ